MTDRLNLLAELTRRVAGAELRDEPLPYRLCAAAVRLLGGTGGAITLAYTHLERVTVCATDSVAETLEQMQDVYSVGPGPTAYTTGEPAALDLGAETSPSSPWQPFAQAAREAVGPVLIQALPMRTEIGTLGVLTYYRSPVRGWEATTGRVGWSRPLRLIERPRTRASLPDLADAMLVSGAVGAALLDEHPSSTTDPSWTSRARVHQATGAVVAQVGVSPTNALALLRAHAFAHDLSMESVATLVIEGRYRFDRTDRAQDQ